MRIVIVGTAWPYRGGLAAFHERLSRQLQAEGHEVELVTFTLQYPSFLFPGKTQYSPEPAPEGLHIVRKLSSVNPLSWCRTGRYVCSLRPDLVVIPYWMPFMAPALATVGNIVRRRGVRVVSIVHNLIPHERRPGDGLLTRWFVRACDAFVALSRSVLTDLDAFDPRRLRPRIFSPHPLYDHYGERLPKEEARRMIGVPEEGRYALFFGFIREYKGLDLLLEAMADRRVRELGVRLLVAGEFYGDPKPYLDRIARLGIGDSVILRNDFIPDHEVNRYFCAADLVAQPYKSATQSGVTQVAYHFEVPMLVTRVGGLPEIVPDGRCGYVVEPAPASIADALVRFFSSDAAGTMIEGVREEKKRYAWDRMTQALLTVGTNTTR